MDSVIYKIENTINSKIYVGSAINFINRKRNHTSALNRNKHHSIHLQRAWNKYGKNSFKFSIIEKCNKKQLIKKEQYWMDTLQVIKNGYNICPSARSRWGFKHTKKTKQKISEKKKGSIPWNKDTKGICKSTKASFKKGRTPWNKDKKGVQIAWNKDTIGIMKPNKTSFQKSHKVSIETIKKRNETRKKNGWNKRIGDYNGKI